MILDLLVITGASAGSLHAPIVLGADVDLRAMVQHLTEHRPHQLLPVPQIRQWRLQDEQRTYNSQALHST